MENRAQKEQKVVKNNRKTVSEIKVKKDYVTNDQMSDFEKRIECEIKAVKFDILRWMIPFHMTTLAFMLTMLYRVFS